MKYFLSLLLLLLTALQAAAQNVSQQQRFENVLTAYNALEKYVYAPANTGADAIRYTDRSATEQITALSALETDTSGDILKVAAYFKSNFKILQGRIRGKGDANAGTEFYRSLAGELEQFQPGNFPLRYELKGKRYIIHYADFSPTLGDIWGELAQYENQAGRYEAAATYAQKAADTPNANPATSIRSTKILLEALKQSGRDRSDYADRANRIFDAATRLSPEARTEFTNQNLNPEMMAWEQLQAVAKDHPGFARKMEIFREAAGYLSRAKYQGEAAQAYQTTLDAGASDGATLNEIMDFAEQEGQKMLGLQAARRWQQKMPAGNCEQMQALSGRFSRLGDAVAARDLSDKAEDCRKDKKREVRRADKSFRMYAGAYVIPLLTLKNRYRDYGGVLNVGNKRFLAELSYLHINSNREVIEFGDYRDKDRDTEFWDGYYAHLALKYHRKSGKASTYAGPLLGYSERYYTPFTATVISPDGQVRVENYRPIRKQYILMMNYGVLGKKAGLNSDLYFGIGLGYNTLDVRNDNWKKDDFTYNNKLLSERKDRFFNFMLRAGFTMGLSVGK
ncbi:MAG: hypothetical protein J0L99_07745 [Chitinophagales bacterium]|nr:hypothetical protein [Chitinophagales bacterium]